MRASRGGLLISSASEGDSPDALPVLGTWAARGAASRASGGRDEEGCGLRERPDSDAPAGGSSASQEDWEEAELALLSPESQKRERRRIANRDCARRIRQRKSELLSELAASVEQLQADHARILATLTGAGVLRAVKC